MENNNLNSTELLPEVSDNITLTDISVEEVINDEVDDSVMDELKHELTDEEKREFMIQSLKNAKNGCKPKIHYGVVFRKERQRKNKQAKSSRKANRK